MKLSKEKIKIFIREGVLITLITLIISCVITVLLGSGIFLGTSLINLSWFNLDAHFWKVMRGIFVIVIVVVSIIQGAIRSI